MQRIPQVRILGRARDAAIRSCNSILRETRNGPVFHPSPVAVTPHRPYHPLAPRGARSIMNRWMVMAAVAAVLVVGWLWLGRGDQEGGLEPVPAASEASPSSSTAGASGTARAGNAGSPVAPPSAMDSERLPGLEALPGDPDYEEPLGAVPPELTGSTGTTYGEWDFSHGLPKGWTPYNEAQRIFEPLRKALEEVEPLTPQKFKEVVRDHRDQGMEVLKEAAAVSKAGYPQEGQELIQAWSTLYRTYSKKARTGGGGSTEGQP